jgi:hypothetical protein
LDENKHFPKLPPPGSSLVNASEKTMAWNHVGVTYVSRGDCSTCLRNIAAKHLLCPNQADATNYWYHDCFLRYSKEDFFGKETHLRIFIN